MESKIRNIITELETKIHGRKLGDTIGARIGAQSGIQTWEIIYIDILSAIYSKINKSDERMALQIEMRLNDIWKGVIAEDNWGHETSQIKPQYGIVSLFLIKNIFNIKYEHPAFELLKLGVFVVRREDKNEDTAYYTAYGWWGRSGDPELVIK